VCNTWLPHRSNSNNSVRFQVLTVANVKMTAFLDVALCSLTEAD
jgi:hypothetical protein